MRLVASRWLPTCLALVLAPALCLGLGSTTRADEVVATSQSAPPGAAPASTAAAARKGPDRLDLDATAIRGNQELPKVLYIVPWKDSGLGEPAGRPLNSLVDDALSPVDREVFRRQMRYFHQLYAAPAAGVGGAGQAR